MLDSPPLTPETVIQIYNNEVWSKRGFVRCSWCGRNICYETDLHTSGDEIELECDHCEKTSEVTRIVSIDYVSKRKEGDNA